MSVDLMQMVKGAVSKQIMGKLGGMLGTDDSKTSSAFESAAGAILGGLMKKAMTKEGAKVVFESAQKQDGSILDKLGDLLGDGKKTAELQKSGGGLLETILGADQAGMLSALAKFLKLDEKMIGSLLKMAAPILMAVVGKYVKSKALDMAGFGKLLGDQKQHLASHMPAALTSSLGFGNLLGEAGKAMTGAVASANKNASKAAKQEGGLLKYLLAIAALALIAWGVWYLFIGPAMVGAIKPKNTPSGRLPFPSAAPASSAGGGQRTQPSGRRPEGESEIDSLGEMGTVLKENFTNITKGLEELKDEAGASELSASISKFSDKVEDLKIGEMTGVGKAASGLLINNFMETIKSLLDKMENESLKSMIMPAIDGLLEKLSPFAK